MECCVEFITLISSEANDISEKEAKKTIACEHVEKALRDLGFGDYVPDVLAVAEEHKEQLKVRSYPSLRYACEKVHLLITSQYRRARKSKARWSKADYRRKSFCDSSRNSSVPQRRSTTPLRNDVSAEQFRNNVMLNMLVIANGALGVLEVFWSSHGMAGVVRCHHFDAGRWAGPFDSMHHTSGAS